MNYFSLGACCAATAIAHRTPIIHWDTHMITINTKKRQLLLVTSQLSSQLTKIICITCGQVLKYRARSFSNGYLQLIGDTCHIAKFKNSEQHGKSIQL